MFLSKAFLERITIVNGFCIAAASGIVLYLCNRKIDTFFDFQIHLAICFVIGTVVFFLAYFIQTTKVGFWIFAVIFSAAWAFVSVLILYAFVTKDMVWFWVIFGVSFLINIGSHNRSREYTSATA